jgi:branched-chain amino acid transport system substrate-binding protein
LWAEAVKKAGSIDRMKVIEALESGISINAPSGKVTMDGDSHHCTLDVTVAEVKNKKFEIVKTFKQEKPIDTSAVCNLKKNPADNQQYVIKV